MSWCIFSQICSKIWFSCNSVLLVYIIDCSKTDFHYTLANNFINSTRIIMIKFKLLSDIFGFWKKIDLISTVAVQPQQSFKTKLCLILIYNYPLNYRSWFKISSEILNFFCKNECFCSFILCQILVSSVNFSEILGSWVGVISFFFFVIKNGVLSFFDVGKPYGGLCTAVMRKIDNVYVTHVIFQTPIINVYSLIQP